MITLLLAICVFFTVSIAVGSLIIYLVLILYEKEHVIDNIWDKRK